MEEINKKKILKEFSEKLDNLVLRSFVQSSVENYDKKATYVIYDGNRVELFDQTFLDLHKNFKQIKSYFISKPISYD
jgi:hypothetical protein